LEMAYALTNLGHLEQKSADGDPQRALQFMQSALEYNQIALVLDPQNEYYRAELGQSHAFLADAQRGVCDLEGALQSRQEGVLLDQDALAEEPDANSKKKRLAFALSGLAVVQVELGRVDDAIVGLETATGLMEGLLLQDPDDKKTIRWILLLKQRLAMLYAVNESYEVALRSLMALDDEWHSYFQDAVTDDSIADELYTTYLIDRAWLAQTMADPELAEQLLVDGMTRSVEALQSSPGNRGAGNLLMLAAFRYWEVKKTLPQDSILMLLPYYYSSSGQTRACFDASLAARKAIMLGDIDRTNELSRYLIDRGYGEATFIQACKTHNFCNGQ